MKRSVFIILMMLIFAVGLTSAEVMLGSDQYGNTYSAFPAVYGGYRLNGREQYIITAEELNTAGGGPGLITSVAFNVTTLNTCGFLPGFSVWMGTTTRSSFSTTDSFETGLDLVYSSTSYKPDLGWNTHPFSPGFMWDGTSNIIVQVTFNMQEARTSNASNRWSGPGANRTLHYHGDSTPWEDRTTGTAHHWRPDMKLSIQGTQPPAGPILALPADNETLVPVKPTFTWLASPAAGMPSGYKLYCDTNNPPQTLLVDTPSTSYSVFSALQPETMYYWQVEAYNSDGNAYSGIFTFTTAPDGTVLIGNEQNNMQLPIYPYYSYTYSQSIYDKNEILAQYNLDGKNGETLPIEKIAYYWNGNGQGINSNLWNVYMGHKSGNQFMSNSDWVPTSSLTEVYSGTVSLGNSEGWVLIELDRPFLYNNLENLVIAVDENQQGYDGVDDYFYSTPSSLNRSLSYYTDGENPSPCDPPIGNRIQGYPNLMLVIGELSDNELPQITMPQELSFIRNAPFDVDFSQYITDVDTPFSQLGISITCVEDQAPLTIEYLPINEPFTAGQFTVRFGSSEDYAFSKQITLSVRDYASGYEVSATFTLNQLEEFNAFARTDMYYELTGETVQFYDITQGNPNYWLWDFGDGNTSTLQHPSHVYEYAGTYDVSLTLGHSIAQEEDSVFYPALITMQGTAVPTDDIPDTWDIAGSPWNIFTDLVLDDEDEVTIDENVVVNIITPDPMVIRGRLAATNVTFQSPGEEDRWGGLRFEGSSQRNPSELVGCTIQDAILPLDIQDASPVIGQTTITCDDLGETALQIAGASGVQINGVEISGYGRAIRISNNGSSLATPTLGNIRVRNSSQTSRSGSWGVRILGKANIEDMKVEDFDTGVIIDGSESAATPTLGNIRVRNSSQTSRNLFLGPGIIIKGKARLEGVIVENYNAGIEIDGSEFASTPTLGNIRVRNSSQTSRSMDTPSTGLRVIGDVTIEDLEVDGFDTGINLDGNEYAATPTLGNIRVRNSSQTSRADNTGINIQGNVAAELVDVEVEGYNRGISFIGFADDRATITPTLGNIRVRNSSQTSRDSSIGIYLYDLKRVKLDDVEIEDYGTGLWVAASGEYNAAATPTLGNIRVRNSSQTSRNSSVGIYLGPSVKGKLKTAVVENTSIGILIDEDNDTVLDPLQIFNCSVGIKAVGTSEPRSLTRHLIIKDAESMRNYDTQSIAIWLADSNSWDVQNNTIYGYPVYLKAENTDVTFVNNIAWGAQQASQPFILENSQVTATYNNTNTGIPLAGAGNFRADPLFVNTQQREYDLTHDSPCIDTGSPSLPLDEDGTISDVGAFTYLHTSAMKPSQRFVPVGTTVTFSNISIGHDYPYTISEWDLGKDGIIEATSREWSHQFNTPGIYNIRLRMKSGNLEDIRDFDGVVVVQEPQLMPPLQLSLQRQGDDIALTWQPVTESILSEAVSVEYYIVYQADSPDGWFDYVDYTRDHQTSFLHTDGANADRRFYFVIGFIGSELDLRQYIQQNRRVRYNDMNAQQMRGTK